MVKVLDLCCGEGGASKGIKLALPNADITGVDHSYKEKYPYKFIRAKVEDFDLSGYDFIWASPPCQEFSLATVSHRQNGAKYSTLLLELKTKLEELGTPFCIENVPNAPLWPRTELCGEMFGLGVIRHRIFYTNFTVKQPVHVNHKGTVRGGQYVTVTGHGGDGKASMKLWSKSMDIDWMTRRGIVQAVPPAYSKYILEEWWRNKEQ